MKSSQDLRSGLQAVDHRSYPAYKSLAGAYSFGSYTLCIEHVQGDPFAAPSQLSVKVSHQTARFPSRYYENRWNRTALADDILRRFRRQAGQTRYPAFTVNSLPCFAALCNTPTRLFHKLIYSSRLKINKRRHRPRLRLRLAFGAAVASQSAARYLIYR